MKIEKVFSVQLLPHVADDHKRKFFTVAVNVVTSYMGTGSPPQPTEQLKTRENLWREFVEILGKSFQGFVDECFDFYFYSLDFAIFVFLTKFA